MMYENNHSAQPISIGRIFRVFFTLYHCLQRSSGQFPQDMLQWRCEVIMMYENNHSAQPISIGRYTAKTFGWMFLGLAVTFAVMLVR